MQTCMLQQYASIMAFSRYLIVALLMFSAGFMLGRMSKRSKTELKVERLTDTVVIRQPEIMVVHTLAPDTVRLAVVDALRDTTHVLVEVPRQQHRYEGEGYQAWVSGFRPSLDSIVIERQILLPQAKPRRWSVGLQAGIGATPRGIQPYFGVGISFKLY